MCSPCFGRGRSRGYRRCRDEWLASGHDWPTHLRYWAKREGLHRRDELIRLFDARLEPQDAHVRALLFPDLVDTTEADEQTAIDAAEIQPTRVDYVGKRL
jgi:hypothetical protein